MPRGKLWTDDLNQTMPIGDRMLLSNLPSKVQGDRDETITPTNEEHVIAVAASASPVARATGQPVPMSEPLAPAMPNGNGRKPHKVRPTSSAHRAIGQIERILSELDAPAQAAVVAYLTAKLKAGGA